MGYQTTLNPEEKGQKPSALFFRQLRRFAKDSRELAILQWQIFQIDCQQAGKQARKTFAILILGCVLMLSATPLVLTGIALSLQMLGLPLWCGLLLVGFAFIAISLLLLWLGYRSGSETVAKFDESMHEWNRNYRWVQQQLGQNRHDS
jgi:hypothetical protein